MILIKTIQGSDRPKGVTWNKTVLTRALDCQDCQDQILSRVKESVALITINQGSDRPGGVIVPVLGRELGDFCDIIFDQGVEGSAR